MIVDELLGRHAVDLVHKALLVGEEVVELVCQPPAEGDAALVTLVQVLHHWERNIFIIMMLILLIFLPTRWFLIWSYPA